MPSDWAKTNVRVEVLVSTAGPLDPPFAGQSFNLTDFAGRNYVLGEPGITIRRGRSDEFQQFSHGTCTFTLRNNAREFDPGNASSPFAAILKPRRRVAVVTYDVNDPSTFTALFVGFIEGWPQSWAATTGTVQVVANDLLSVLSQTSVDETAGALVLDSVFQGQLDQERLAGDLPQQFTGERVGSLCQLAGISAQVLALQTGLTEVTGLEPSGDVLALCQEAAIAEAGFFFVDRNGTVTFLDRHSRFQHTRLGSVQASFTDQQYTGMTVDFSTTQMWNDARFTRPPVDENDVPHVAIEQDEVSIHENGRRQYAKTIPVVSDGETLGRAQFWIQRYSEPKRRPSPVTIRPRKNLPVLFPAVARLELLDRIQLSRTPLGIAPTDVFVGLVETLEHRISKTDWVCTIGISLIDVDDGTDCLVLDDASLGQLDQEVLCY